MSAKEVKFSTEAREKMLRGVDILARAKTEQFDGFEVWDGNRFVYRLHASDEQPAPSS
jgi:hypothetical protein